MPTDITKDADSSASGVIDAVDWVAAAVILSRYPSRDSIIWFDRGGRLTRENIMGLAFMAAAPPNSWETPSLAASSCRLLATYAARNFIFHAVYI